MKKFLRDFVASLCASLLIWAPQVALLVSPMPVQAESPCDTTVSNASQLISEVGSVPNNQQRTICLSNGSYGSPLFSGLSSRTAMITIRSQTGKGATIGPSVRNSRFLRFRSVTLTQTFVDQCSRNIEYVNSDFVPNSDGLIFNNEGMGCGTSHSNYLVDGVVFHKVGRANGLTEGRLAVRGAVGVTIRNSTFSNIKDGGDQGADGIQVHGSSGQVVIGPNNKFYDIEQNARAGRDGRPAVPSCDPAGNWHCDPIQNFGCDGSPGVTIIGNYFFDNETGFMGNGADCAVSIMHNIFVTDGNYPDQIIRAGQSGDLIEHNTLPNGGRLRFGDGLGAATNVIVRNNIITGGIYCPNGYPGPSTITFSFNVWNGSVINSNCTLTQSNNIVGAPTFVNGTVGPNNWAGFSLSSGSLGKDNASDGNDRGTNYFSPAAPTNFQTN